MEIDWQQASYVATTIGMTVVAAFGVFGFWILYNVLLFVRKVNKTIEEGNRLIDDIHYFQKGVRLGIVRFLLKIIERGGKNEQQ